MLALFYELITGNPPRRPLKTPSTLSEETVISINGLPIKIGIVKTTFFCSPPYGLMVFKKDGTFRNAAFGEMRNDK